MMQPEDYAKYVRHLLTMADECEGSTKTNAGAAQAALLGAASNFAIAAALHEVAVALQPEVTVVGKTPPIEFADLAGRDAASATAIADGPINAGA